MTSSSRHFPGAHGLRRRFSYRECTLRLLVLEERRRALLTILEQRNVLQARITALTSGAGGQSAVPLRA